MACLLQFWAFTTNFLDRWSWDWVSWWHLLRSAIFWPAHLLLICGCPVTVAKRPPFVPVPRFWKWVFMFVWTGTKVQKSIDDFEAWLNGWSSKVVIFWAIQDFFPCPWFCSSSNPWSYLWPEPSLFPYQQFPSIYWPFQFRFFPWALIFLVKANPSGPCKVCTMRAGFHTWPLQSDSSFWLIRSLSFGPVVSRLN